ncbi:hypothetical protein Bandiella_01461 [Candidatus Bandiella woodruffii]|uniref:Uncharacterized protein n=1 Tax=Candidatus Bandiella euplotis TaxID=1664265 RepID=A0ABZ0UNM5_9RICK|nr:hypothetical protein Bandiella_01461 [Candidatus Bandiella woodruffii]
MLQDLNGGIQDLECLLLKSLKNNYQKVRSMYEN